MTKYLDGKTAWRVHENATGALLIDGRDYYAAFHAAATTAQKSICLLGWQFDSDVQLLRGDDVPAGVDPRDFELVRFLDRLCRERPDLEVRVLAWDHSFVFTLERQILQKFYFDAVTCKKFQFRWDDTVSLGGSHHQKVAIVDGRIAFTGSQDICHSRWDDSSHRADNVHRRSRMNIVHKPYHEVQAVVTGAPARSLLELFVERWQTATGEDLEPASLVHAVGVHADEINVPVTLPLEPGTIGISRTMPDAAGREPAFEVRELLVRGVTEAERLIYIESQYLTCCALRDALVARMRDESRPKLDVVVVLPHKPEAFKEEITIGMPQQLLLARLDDVAHRHGHRLGVYNVVAPSAVPGEGAGVYIHAKLMIVDDRLLTLGSANFTNRSMTIDSEVNLAWEPSALRGERARSSIRRARVRLLLEHVGETARVRDLVAPAGLVDRLDAYVRSGASRLRRHEIIHDRPGLVATRMQELACEILDPFDGEEELIPRSAA